MINISEFALSDLGVLEKKTSEGFVLRITLVIETSSLAAGRASWLCMTVKGLITMMYEPEPSHSACCHPDLWLHQHARIGQQRFRHHGTLDRRYNR